MNIQSGSKKTILVTCATGNTGFSTIKLLCSDESLMNEFSVRAGCYVGSERQYVLEKQKGLEMYKFDADNYDDALVSAFDGVDYAFLIPSRSRNRVSHVRNYVDACKKNNVGFIVLYSLIRPETPTNWGKDYDRMESIVEQSGINYAFIRTTLQQQSLFLFAPDIARNALPLPIGQGRIALVSTWDIARAVRTIFRRPNQHSSKAFHLTGPELQSGIELARIASETLQRDIRFVNVTPTGCKKLLIDSGLEDWLAEEFLEMFSDISDGKFEYTTTSLLRSMTGLVGVTTYDFFLEHKQRFTRPGEKPIRAPPEGIMEKEEMGGYSKASIGGAASRKTKVVVNAGDTTGITPTGGTRSYYTEAKPSYGTGGGYKKGKRSVTNQLERTVEMLQRWIYQEEALIDHLCDMERNETKKMQHCVEHLRDMQKVERQRLQSFQEFRNEASETLRSYEEEQQ